MMKSNCPLLEVQERIHKKLLKLWNFMKNKVYFALRMAMGGDKIGVEWSGWDGMGWDGMGWDRTGEGE